MKFIEKLSYLCEEKNIPITTLAGKLEKPITPSAISYWKRGRNPSRRSVVEISNFFSVPVKWLIDDTYDISDLSTFINKTDDKIVVDNTIVQIPVYGTIAGGLPSDAIQEVLEYIDIPASLSKTGEFFGLRVKGNSMFPTIPNGSTVIIKRTSDCESGQICAVLVNGDEATLKRVIKLPYGGIKLIPENDVFPIITYSNTEVESFPVTIIGIATEVRTKL